jgi:hypothetical protein
VRLIVHPSAAGSSNCVRAYFVWHADLLKKANDDIRFRCSARDPHPRFFLQCLRWTHLLFALPSKNKLNGVNKRKGPSWMRVF